VRWSGNFWGQFINAQGLFNEKLGQKMRQTKTFPFWPRYAWCTFGSLREHLRKLPA
jgi:hypothetical protein